MFYSLLGFRILKMKNKLKKMKVGKVYFLWKINFFFFRAQLLKCVASLMFYAEQASQGMKLFFRPC